MIRNEKGFTLIEIIAVLVVLGILAAVAIPKYIDVADDARKKAVQGALAAGASNASMLFSKAILTSGTVPTMDSLASDLSVNTYQKVGDFTVSYSADGNTGIKVTVSAWSGGTLPSLDSEKEKTFTLNPA